MGYDSLQIRADVVSVLQALVRIRSTSEEPQGLQECAEFIRGWLEESGVRAEIRRSGDIPNVVASVGDGVWDTPSVIWNGHYDVVNPSGAWSFDPFCGECRDGYVLGRGTCDMKSGIASMMVALKYLSAQAAGRGEVIAFSAVGDEETGSINGTRHLLKHWKIDRLRYAIVSEPSSLDIELGNRGLRWIDVVVYGEPSHAGRPHLGVNAIVEAARIVQALEKVTFERTDRRFGTSAPSLTVTMIDGGDAYNVVPDKCRIGIDRRMLPGETGEEVVNQVRELVLKAGSANIRKNVEVASEGWDPYVISKREDVVGALMESFEQIAGRKARLRYKSACTDASHIYHATRVPVVIFGPGNEYLSHKPDEKVAVQNLCQSTEVLIDLSRKLFLGVTSA